MHHGASQKHLSPPYCLYPLPSDLARITWPGGYDPLTGEPAPKRPESPQRQSPFTRPASSSTETLIRHGVTCAESSILRIRNPAVRLATHVPTAYAEIQKHTFSLPRSVHGRPNTPEVTELLARPGEYRIFFFPYQSNIPSQGGEVWMCLHVHVFNVAMVAVSLETEEFQTRHFRPLIFHQKKSPISKIALFGPIIYYLPIEL